MGDGGTDIVGEDAGSSVAVAGGRQCQFLCGISRCGICGIPTQAERRVSVVVAVAMARVLVLLTMSLMSSLALPAAAPSNMPFWQPSYFPGPQKRQFMEGTDHCQVVQQQTHLDLHKMTGWWHVVETIGHRLVDRTRSSGITNLTVCPTIHIRVDNEKYRTILLTWEEPKGTVTYRFQVPSPDDPGFWVSLGQQNGTYVDNPRLQYRQFAGSVQVLKAVGTHLVLRFCSIQTHHYTVVMARQNNISQLVVDEVNRMIQDRGLPLFDIRRACVGAATNLLVTTPLLVIATHFVYFVTTFLA